MKITKYTSECICETFAHSTLPAKINKWKMLKKKKSASLIWLAPSSFNCHRWLERISRTEITVHEYKSDVLRIHKSGVHTVVSAEWQHENGGVCKNAILPNKGTSSKLYVIRCLRRIFSHLHRLKLASIVASSFRLFAWLRFFVGSFSLFLSHSTSVGSAQMFFPFYSSPIADVLFQSTTTTRTMGTYVLTPHKWTDGVYYFIWFYSLFFGSLPFCDPTQAKKYVAINAIFPIHSIFSSALSRVLLTSFLLRFAAGQGVGIGEWSEWMACVSNLPIFSDSFSFRSVGERFSNVSHTAMDSARHDETTEKRLNQQD